MFSDLQRRYTWIQLTVCHKSADRLVRHVEDAIMDRAKTAAEQIATVRGSGASRADNVTWLKSRHAQIDLAGLLPESRQVAS